MSLFLSNQELSHTCISSEQKIKVSVIVPCYNEPEDIFRKSLESVINQTLHDIQIIIILDNPENNKLEGIILEYLLRYENILFFNPGVNLGRGEARNFGVQGSHGEYIAIHDADDVDMPERLEEQYQFMSENPNMGVCFSNTHFIDAQGNILKGQGQEPHPNAKSVFRKRLNHQTMFIRKSIFEQIGGYQNLNHGEDIELWMQLWIQGIQMGKCNSVHSHYLIPVESKHSNYIEKLKKWRLSSLHFYRRHLKYLYNDPLFYKFLCGTIGDYIFLHFGKYIYLRYRNISDKIKNKILS